ncbi:MAG: hypothetical protein ACRDGF_01865, partial [Chloroflexota bacterium]
MAQYAIRADSLQFLSRLEEAKVRAVLRRAATIASSRIVSPAAWDRWALVALLVLAKGTIVLVAFLGWKLLPFAVGNYQVNFVDPAQAGNSLATLFSTWDGQHFLYLSQSGYRAGILSDNQFPLYPALIHLAAPIFGGSARGALVVSNVASLIGFCLLFDLVRLLYDRALAWRTVLLYLAFPTAFFFALVYSEAIFFLLAMLFFHFLFRGRLAWAALPAALLPLARAPGFLILIPFVSYYLVEVAGLGRPFWGVARHDPGTATVPADAVSAAGTPSGQAAGWLDEFKPRALWSPRALLVLSPLLGVGAYLGFMYLATGNPFEMARAAASNVSGFSPTLFMHPGRLVHQ